MNQRSLHQWERDIIECFEFALNNPNSNCLIVSDKLYPIEYFIRSQVYDIRGEWKYLVAQRRIELPNGSLIRYATGMRYDDFKRFAGQWFDFFVLINASQLSESGIVYIETKIKDRKNIRGVW